jgi:exportin-2 (importin alpha re-exporter)
VAYTYAAIAIERILFMKHSKQPLYVLKKSSTLRHLEMTSSSRFTPVDVAPWANLAILALLTKIEAGGSPEKVSENDYLMKCK